MIMKKEYDFSKAEKGKFYTPKENIEIPIYLDPKIQEFYTENAKRRDIPLGKLVNNLLKKEMDILHEFTSTKS
jgi:hypothetical protein